MGVTATNLLQGPATLYWAAFGAEEPATIEDAFGVGWTDLGGTQEGFTLKTETEMAALTVDQIVDELGATLTSRNITGATTLAEATLDNLARVLNEPVPAAAVGDAERELNLTEGVAAFQLPYAAIGIDGVAPGGKRRRVILRRTLSVEGTETANKKDGQTLFPVTWKAYYVSPSIRFIRVIEG